MRTFFLMVPIVLLNELPYNLMSAELVPMTYPRLTALLRLELPPEDKLAGTLRVPAKTLHIKLPAHSLPTSLPWASTTRRRPSPSSLSHHTCRFRTL